MKKRMFKLSLLVLIITASVLTGAQVNPALAQSTIPLPIVTILPADDIYYNSSTINMAFTVRIPQGSKYTWISWIVYFLDGQEKGEIWPKSTDSLDKPFTVTLTDVPSGWHSFKVYAYYPSSIAPIIGQATTNFRVSNPTDTSSPSSPTISPSQSSSPSPSSNPSLPPSQSPSSSFTPTPAPATSPPTSIIPSPEPQSGFLGTNLPLEYGYAIIAALVIAVAAGLSLVYFRNRGK